MLRLSEVERLIRLHRLVVPEPTRRSLIQLCEDGTFDAVRWNGRKIWLVTEDSFLAWVKGLGGHCERT